MKTNVFEPHKSSLGMDANIAALVVWAAMAVVSWLPYIGWVAWAVPVVIYIIEKESKFVKHQAVYALMLGVVRAVFSIIFQILIWIATPRDLVSAMNFLTGRGSAALTIIGALSTLIGLALTVLMVLCIVLAYSYKEAEVPVLTPLAQKIGAILDGFSGNK